MTMINQLITDITYDNIKLSQALTRAKLIANKTKNESFKTWINRELEGYHIKDDSIPPYRKIWSPIILTIEYSFNVFKKMPISTSNTDDEMVSDFINNHRIVEPIVIVEQQIENLVENKGYITIPENLVEIVARPYKKSIEESFAVIRKGSREIGKIHYQNVLEQTKQKLLDILIELENEFPDLLNEYRMTEENNDKIQNIITNHIHGNNNPMNFATGQTVNQNNNTYILLQTDLAHLKSLGVDDIQVKELKTIVSENSKDKASLKSKVLKWLGSVSSSIAAKGLYDNIPALTEFVNKLI